MSSATRTVTTKIPDGYRAPTTPPSDTRWHYWLTEQPGSGATTRYMVIADGRGEQHIVAERCYLAWGIVLVDALRDAGPTTEPVRSPQP